MSARIGTGCTIEFSTGFFAEILDIRGPAASRESVQTSHMGTTTAHTFVPGDLVDWGEVTVELAFDPSEKPPMNDVAEEVTITFAPDQDDSSGGSNEWVFDAALTGFEPQAPLEGRMTATATLKVTGVIAVDGV